MYWSQPSFVLGFHGCDSNVAESVFAGNTFLKPSQNDYDWLGHGVYFWENDPVRAMCFAQTNTAHPQSKIKMPAVIGAVIDLGHCFNLMEASTLQLLKDGYQILEAAMETAGISMPINKHAGRDQFDLLLRHLDCAVIETIHETRTKRQEPAFDTVRGVFWEGGDLYPNAGFKEKNHIQICVRNPNCIKGFFRVRERDHAFSLPKMQYSN